MRFVNLQLLSLTIMISLLFVGSKWLVLNSFSSAPDAPIATAAQIHELITDESSTNRFVIVDVRSKAESDVSMIPGALTKSEFENTAHEHQGKLVIAYCTIGVRSGYYAADLIQKGWTARNYRGSILDWCENNSPLTCNGVETNLVHTYSPRYSVNENYVAVN